MKRIGNRNWIWWGVACLQEQLGNFLIWIILHAWSVSGRYSVRHRPRLRQLLSAADLPVRSTGRWGGVVKEEPDWNEIIVCMVVAFCMGNALITVIYRLVG